jgi:O-methyltransferase involved in polyketide biosynthesis
VTDAQLTDPGLDVRLPAAARIWDYQLGGKDSFAVDRAVADAADELCRRAGAPGGYAVARESRDFLGRAVRHLAGAGIRQFVDIGCGYPVPANVHQIARQVNGDARVVYVDNDPIVLAHGRAFLADEHATRVVDGDLLRPEELFGAPDLRALVDLRRPVAVLLSAVLDLLPDEADPVGIVARIGTLLAPGSYVVVTHLTGDTYPDLARALTETYTDAGVPTPPVFRTRAAVARFLTGFELVEPGLSDPSRWPTGADPGTRWTYAAVARKPLP